MALGISGRRVAQRDLCGDVGQRIAGGLAGQSARAREPGVDLDDAVIGAPGVERVLDVALADDAEMADGLDRHRAEQLVLLVVERLARGHDDGLARVDAHRVEVLHVADGDAVVAPVAHHLVLDLLPAAQALLDQHLGHAAGEGAARAPGRGRPRSRRCRCPGRRGRSPRAASPGSRSRGPRPAPRRPCGRRGCARWSRRSPPTAR